MSDTAEPATSQPQKTRKRKRVDKSDLLLPDKKKTPGRRAVKVTATESRPRTLTMHLLISAFLDVVLRPTKEQTNQKNYVVCNSVVVALWRMLIDAAGAGTLPVEKQKRLSKFRNSLRSFCPYIKAVFANFALFKTNQISDTQISRTNHAVSAVVNVGEVSLTLFNITYARKEDVLRRLGLSGDQTDHDRFSQPGILMKEVFNNDEQLARDTVDAWFGVIDSATVE